MNGLDLRNNGDGTHVEQHASTRATQGQQRLHARSKHDEMLDAFMMLDFDVNL